MHHVDAALTVAGINGTVLAIAVAALTGYSLMVLQSVHRMQTELIELANATRRSAPLSLGVMVTPDVPWDTAVSFDDHARRFRRLSVGENPDEEPVAPAPGEVRVIEPWQPPEGEDFRGETFLALMSQMPRKPPFTDDPDRDVRDLDGVQHWLDEVELRIISLTDNFRINFDTIQELVATVLARRVERFAEREHRTPDDVRSSLVETRTSLKENLPTFEKWAEGYRLGIATVKATKDALTRYERRAFPPVTIAVVVALSIAAIFIGGVAIPVVHPSVSDVVYAWLPMILYGIGLIGGLSVAVARIPKRKRKEGARDT